MSKTPKVTSFIDPDEHDLADAIEAEGYIAGRSLLKPGDRERYAEMARKTIDGEKTKITIRLSSTDLARLKAKAIREGMPYQTLIGSILHKAVS